MKESPYPILVHDPQKVGFVDDYLIIDHKDVYKVIAQDGNTLTIVKANIFLRMWDTLMWKLQDLRWKALDLYFDVTDWIEEKIKSLHKP